MRFFWIAWVLVAGCFASHELDGERLDDGAVVLRDAGPFARRDAGRPIRRDGGGPIEGDGGGPIRRDGGGPIGRDAGRDIVDECVATCDHAIACEADIDTRSECISGCVEIEPIVADAVCGPLVFAVLDCIQSLSCEELRGRDPGRTRCAPIFDDFERECGDLT